MRLVGSFGRVKKRWAVKNEKSGNKMPGSDVSSIAFP
jgi:hypothetical protein